MTDRELLELAANATGHQWQWVTCPKYAGIVVPGMLELDSANEIDYWPGWNPLEDDGDALRLVVKLRIKLDFDSDGAWAWVVGFTAISLFEPFDGDPEYATRRAIVRAAAEIGKAMQ